ncbi:MAG: nucleotidyltransferase domain-containing protein [Balneolaceae bacterium]
MKRIESILSAYAEEHPEIAAIYLFGSQASGRAHPESDVDVAILYSGIVNPDFHQTLEVQDELISLLRQEVDIVILNSADPVIRMQVLRKGEKVFERDRKAVNRLFVRTMNEYDDLKRVRAIIEKNILKGGIYG